MVAKAKGRFLMCAPRKVRAVCRLLGGLDVPRALGLLQHLPKAACRPVGKVLESAVANATRGGTWSEEQLVVSRILADEGPAMKRFRAGPMGRANRFSKRMCHLTIELDTQGGPSHGA